MFFDFSHIESRPNQNLGTTRALSSRVSNRSPLLCFIKEVSSTSRPSIRVRQIICFFSLNQFGIVNFERSARCGLEFRFQTFMLLPKQATIRTGPSWIIPSSSRVSVSILRMPKANLSRTGACKTPGAPTGVFFLLESFFNRFYKIIMIHLRCCRNQSQHATQFSF